MQKTEAPQEPEASGSTLFDRLLFQNQVSLDIKDRYVPDFDEVTKPDWHRGTYLAAQLENNNEDVPPARAQWAAPATTTFPVKADQAGTLTNKIPRSHTFGGQNDLSRNTGFARTPQGDQDGNINLPDPGEQIPANRKNNYQNQFKPQRLPVQLGLYNTGMAISSGQNYSIIANEHSLFDKMKRVNITNHHKSQQYLGKESFSTMTDPYNGNFE